MTTCLPSKILAAEELDIFHHRANLQVEIQGK